MAVRISLRPTDHHAEHADSLSGPLGDCERSVYKAREGERSRSEEEVIRSCLIEERGMKTAHMTDSTPLYKPIHSILNYNACTFYPYVTFP